MIKNMNKNLDRRKIVVLWLSLLFVFGMFTSAMACQNNNSQSGPNPLPLSGDASWWNTDWQYRKKITIDHSKVADTLTNFPVLININSDADLANNAQDDGDDIAFIANSDVQLNHEIEYFNGSTGELVAWVNVTSLSSTEDTIFYIYYGNPDCSNQQSVNGVWDSGFVMVQHLNEISDTHYDSTSYGNDGLPQNGLNQNAGGKFDGADEFDGDDDYIDCGNDLSLNITDFLSVEAWVNFTEIGRELWQGIVTKHDYMNWAFAVGGTQAPGKAVIYITGASGGASGDVISISPINDGLWHHIIATYDGSITRIYVDGIEENNSAALTGPINTSTKNLLIGHYETLPRPFNGRIDEVRLSNIVRDADWIMTGFYNQHNPNMFYSVGSEVTLNINPIANFTYSPENPSTQDTIQFTDTSTDPDGTIVSWFWDFDDGNTSNQQNPTHQYVEEGTYEVSLNVTDDDGATDEINKEITVANVQPIANFTYSPTVPTPNEIIQFTDTSMDPDGTIVSWFWDFDDGNTSTEQNPIKFYTQGGIYIVTLNVTDDNGLTNETSQNILVNTWPIADFSYDPLDPLTNENILFTDQSVDPYGPVVSWLWNFGDGNTSTEQNPIHKYVNNGTYLVTLNVTDEYGLTNETSQNITIITTIFPIANFTYLPVSPTDLDNVTFIDNSTDEDGYIVSWYWDFGDGNTSTKQNPVHQYADDGTYEVTLNVTDNNRAKNETTQYIIVRNIPPTANFTYIPHHPEINESVQFNDSSVDLDGTIISWFWDFGDGNTSTEQNPQNTYSSFKTYIVILNVSDDDGDTNEISMNIVTKVTYKEEIEPGENEVDLISECDTIVNINVTNSTNITVEVYSGNPTNENIPNNMSSIDKYINISVENESAVVWPIEIKIYYTQDDLINSGIEEYQLFGIYYWNDSAEEWQLYSDTGVNTTYNENGYEGYCWANARHLTHLCLGADTDPPPKVTGLTVNDARYGKLNLAWNEATDNVAVDNYKIYRDGVFLINTTSTSYSDTGLTNGQSYSYEISAIDTSDNEGEKSDPVSGIPTAGVSAPPAAPPANEPPVADAGGPYYGFINDPITFDGTGSTDDITIVTFDWNYGDGTTGSGVSPTHTYTDEGNYTVTLIVTDNGGRKGTDITFAVISELPNNPPDIPSINGPQKLTKNIQYNYIIKAIDIDDDNIRYVIDWGDGENLTTDYFSTGTIYNANHTWSTSGIYTIKLCAEDEFSRSGTINLKVYVDIPIDYIEGEIQGYLIDTNNDGTYDTFYNNVTGVETNVEKQIDGTYLINIDLDEDWEYIYDIDTNTLIPYGSPSEEEKTDDNTVWYLMTIMIIIAIIIVIIIYTIIKKGKTQKK